MATALASNSDTKTLMIIPAYTNAFGGMMVSLSLLAQGFQSLGMADRLRILVRSGTLIESYLSKAGLRECLQVLDLPQGGFFRAALDWVYQQPAHWPLLLDNCVWRSRLPKLIKASFPLRRSGRPVFHFCHDLALSKNRLGGLVRKLTFACLAPDVICNSHFTASYVRQIMPNIKGVLYQPVDLERIDRCRVATLAPPDAIKQILASGSKVMLTPSRINQPGIINDKNLRALLPVLAALKQRGHNYCGVVIGEDRSDGNKHTQDLLKQAAAWNVADQLVVLPNTFEIETYYHYADVVVTLAPREPFGRTVVEAIACGVPVVGSHTGGIQEILHTFAPEWTVDPQDAEQVAETIIQVTTAPTTAEVLQHGQAWIQEHCSPDTYARGMMQLVGMSPMVPELALQHS